MSANEEPEYVLEDATLGLSVYEAVLQKNRDITEMFDEKFSVAQQRDIFFKALGLTIMEYSIATGLSTEDAIAKIRTDILNLNP